MAVYSTYMVSTVCAAVAHDRDSLVGVFSGRLWTGRRKSLVNQWNEKYALPMSPCILSKYRRARSAVAMVQGSRRGRLLRAQAGEVSPPDKLESLVYSVGEMQARAHVPRLCQKTVKVQIDTPPASPTRTASLPVHSSVDSLVWSQRPCLLPSRSVRLHFALGATSAVEGRPFLAQRLFFSLSPPNNSAAHPQHPPFTPQLATRSPTSLICQDV